MAADRFEIRIAITPPEMFPGEGDAIARLLKSGRFTHVHLRHPSATRREMLRLIESVPQPLHNRLRLHGHFDLVLEFNLGGLHLNSRCPEPLSGYSGSLSRSCHTIDEVIQSAETERFEYVTLSPVFDSLSKPGYNGIFADANLSPLTRLPLKVVALGGITPSRLTLLSQMPFAGYAMLGAVQWLDPH